MEMTFGNYLQRLLSDRKLTFAEFARLIKKTRGNSVTPSYIGSLVAGRRRAPISAIPNTYTRERARVTLTMTQLAAALSSAKPLTREEEQILLGYSLSRIVGTGVTESQERQIELITKAERVVLADISDYPLPPDMPIQKVVTPPYPKTQVSVKLKDGSRIVIDPRARVRPGDHALVVQRAKKTFSVEKVTKIPSQFFKLMKVIARFY